MAFDEPLDLVPRARPVPLLDMLGGIAVEQVANRRSIDMSPALGDRVLAGAHVVEDAKGILACSIGGDLAVLAQRHPPGTPLMVPILNQVGTHPAGQHTQAEPRDKHELIRVILRSQIYFIYCPKMTFLTFPILPGKRSQSMTVNSSIRDLHLENLT
jgi:hypothetical protein